MGSRSVLSVWKCWALAAAVALSLVGCAVPEWQKPGTSAVQIAQDFGQPHVRTALPDGGERWVYSRQPAGQQVYHMVFDGQQRLQRVEQVLQEGYFHKLQPGVDDRRSVFNYFGKPALIERVGNFKGDIWTYRIRENSIDRQAHVFIDPQGVVQRVMFTDEPRNDPDDRH
ncbi:MAG: hypothetical protein ACN6NT_08700 [Comamonas sp.]